MNFGLNAGMNLVAGLLDLRLDPYQSCNFMIEIEGIMVGSFSECSGLQVETEVEPYREGGQNDFIHQFAGSTKHPSLVLKHGLTLIDGLWGWHQDVVGRKIERRNGTIFLLNKMRIPVMWWDFSQALPVKWTGPELRAENAAVAFESVELVHQGLSRPRVETALAGAAAAALSGGISADLNISAKLSGGLF